MNILLIQLPIPQLNFGKQAGNVPLGAACLKQAAAHLDAADTIDILPEDVATYLGDAALIRTIIKRRPEIVGFTAYCWNIQRSLYIARKIKEHLGSKIVFGGPEITADNPFLSSPEVDVWVFGDGEAVFRRLLEDPAIWRQRYHACSATEIFSKAPSPYIAGLLDAHIENTCLLETQRGCPYTCGYCYYNKSISQPSYADPNHLRRAVRWAFDHDIAELFFLDPAFQVRPDIITLLKEISTLNKSGKMALLSEIRAETITPRHADLFAAAGFTWFEIGLQSIHPDVQKQMQRPVDLNRFLRGVSLLQERQIRFGIDLMAGLPGDDLAGFKRSVDFVVEKNLDQDVLVFPLSVLPGTEFRKTHAALGLDFSPQPPYLISRTTTFSADDLYDAIIYAESALGVALYPLPDLDLSWRSSRSKQIPTDIPDRCITIGSEQIITKLLLFRERSDAQLTAAAQKLAHPYQIFFGGKVSDSTYIRHVLKILSAINPFTPFEVIFIDPATVPNLRMLLAVIQLQRPAYLDHELRYLYRYPGNRSVQFTIVSDDVHRVYTEDMQRQIYWWRHNDLPDSDILDGLTHVDGVLIDPPAWTPETIWTWQDHFAPHAQSLQLISFADMAAQHRWRILTQSDDYYLKLHPVKN